MTSGSILRNPSTNGLRLTLAQQFLCCSVADDEIWHGEDLSNLWRQVGDDRAWNIAKQNDCESITALALKEVIDRDSLSPRWEKSSFKLRARLTLFMNELDRVSKALAVINIPIVALKNSGIARGIYPILAGNPMGDIDLLVKTEDFERSHQVLKKLGYELKSRSPLSPTESEDVRRSGGTEYHIELSDKTTLWLELQWRTVAGRWINEQQEPRCEDLIDRSIPIDDTFARLLSPVDNLVQVCLHTAKHSYVRAPGFRLHTDVDRIVRRCNIEWHIFVEMVSELRVCTVVYFSLWLATMLLRTPVPRWVLVDLSPNRLKKWAIVRMLLKVGLFDPDTRKWGKFGYIVFNIMLYDSVKCALRSTFPTLEWMRKRYRLESTWTAPILYGKRILDLLFNRANI